VKASIDPKLCQGHNVCTFSAPRVFEADEDGYGHVLDPDVAPGLQESARVAALNCPEAAILIEE
jgi:ferredoxin